LKSKPANVLEINELNLPRWRSRRSLGSLPGAQEFGATKGEINMPRRHNNPPTRRDQYHYAGKRFDWYNTYTAY
jgi:hypothetical protein